MLSDADPWMKPLTTVKRARMTAGARYRAECFSSNAFRRLHIQ